MPSSRTLVLVPPPDSSCQLIARTLPIFQRVCWWEDLLRGIVIVGGATSMQSELRFLACDERSDQLDTCYCFVSHRLQALTFSLKNPFAAPPATPIPLPGRPLER